MDKKLIFTVPATAVTDGQHFASLLRVTRQSAGLSIAKVARALYRSEGAVILREQGHRNVTVDEAIKHLQLAGYQLVVMPAGTIGGPADAVRDAEA